MGISSRETAECSSCSLAPGLPRMPRGALCEEINGIKVDGVCFDGEDVEPKKPFAEANFLAGHREALKRGERVVIL